MRRSGGAQPVDRLERDVDRRVAADADVVAVEIVIDGRGHADHGEAFACEACGPRLRAVAADHHQRIYSPATKIRKGLRAPRGLDELGAARGPADREGTRL